MNKETIDLTDAEILIVDDIPANLDLLCQALEPRGYNAIAAASGETALKIAERARPDLILLDIMMPGIDGFETCRRLKANPVTADIPVIFITAQHETKSIVKGFKVGGVDYITKPVQHEEVLARVQTHLTIKYLRDGLREANRKLETAYNQLEADNARKTEELETAHVIQQGFLPVAPPALPYLDIAAFQQPATEVGGDYYDFFPHAGDKLLVVVGDATGHGVGASLMVSATKMALRLVDEPCLQRKIAEINMHLKQINNYHRLNMGLTLVELSHDETSGTVRVKAAGGGMPPLIILRSNGDVEEMMNEGLPLGAMETAKYTLTEFRLEASDLLVAMSDGLPERINDMDDQLGYKRIAARIKETGKGASPEEILEDLAGYGDDWSNNTAQNDDITLVVLKVKGA